VPDTQTVPTDEASDARRVVVVGPVTWDRMDDQRRPGGAVSFAARTADAFGVRMQVLALAGADADLDALSEHEVVIVEGASTLIMEHEFGPAGRLIRVPVTAARIVEPSDVPDGWSTCSDLVLAPLLSDELDAPALVEVFAADRLWVLAQGFQRVRADDGAITFLDRPAEVLAKLAGPATSVFLSADETSDWAAGALERLATSCARVVHTQGHRGADILHAGGAKHIDSVPAERVDTTGAGDVFATAFILACDGETDEASAGRIAAGFAAAAVERVGPTRLPSLAEIEARVARAARHADSREGGASSAEGPS
jgi:sugar/nucleoside kinase (ribokinase family)